jgi:predicted HTH domain antitoxin
MSVTLDIPDEVLAAMPVPEADRERYLLLEIACTLYERDLLTLGKAAALAGISKIDLGRELGTRGIPRHYSETELAADLAYAGGE